jgi:glucose/arabinose dehydrogenase/cytochrome c553
MATELQHHCERIRGIFIIVNDEDAAGRSLELRHAQMLIGASSGCQIEKASGTLATVARKVAIYSRESNAVPRASLMNGHRLLNGHRLRNPLGVCFPLLAASVLHAPAFAADAAAGKALFLQQCAVCHTAEPNDNGGAQGPSLIGLYGRRAGADPSFGYTPALKNSKLTWNAATLSRFLSAPTQVVPGTAMVVAVPDKTQRANLIGYFKEVKATVASTPATSAARSTESPKEGDWRKDTPGRQHRIDLATLPPPFSSESARNSPKLVPRPPDAQLHVPPGFRIDVFASDLIGPRRLIVAGNGDLFVTEMLGGRVSVLHQAPDGRTSSSAHVFADGLNRPYGIAFYPNADNPTWLYVAETNRVVRFPFKSGDVKARSGPEVVVPELPTGGHSTRDIVFSPDGRRMFVSVGSLSNYAEAMAKKTVRQAQEWERTHGLGATWDQEENRADVLVFDVDSKGPGKTFATGLRNCVSLTLQPGTGDLWCTTNERDALGDDLVPDYSTRVKEGGFYGWPWYYMGSNEEPRLKGDRPDLKNKVLVPDVPYQSHSAALNLVFYTATSGKSAFPAEYVGDGFAMFHGSWNRGFRTGHKVVRVRMKDGVPTGEYDDFVTGFIVDDGNAWGRPVAAAVLHDGSLVFSDDAANVIYRVAYEKSAPP